MRTIYAEYNINHDSIDVYTSAGYMLRIDCWEAEKDLKTTYGSECALTSLAVDEPLEYARLYLEGNLQMWVDAEDSFNAFKSLALIFLRPDSMLAYVLREIVLPASCIFSTTFICVIFGDILTV